MSGSTIPCLDHVGIAVRDLDARLALYVSGLGLVASPPEEVPSEGVRVVFLPAGDTRLELLEPTADDSPIARFLERHGEGVHHICITVADLDGTLARLEKQGIALVDRRARTGAEGSRVAFVHPRGAGGVLLELKEATPR